MDEPHVIDINSNLIGVLTRPSKPEFEDNFYEQSVAPVAVLLYNAGFLHHVGPNRINTTLARHLADLGFVSLRFDFSGLGDSAARDDILENGELVRKNASSAMNFIQSETGINKFVLIGFCSGAVDALHIAMQEERVAGFIAVDGIGFRTKRFYFRHVVEHLAQRFFSLNHWRRYLRRFARSRSSKTAYSPNNTNASDFNAMVDDGDLTRKSQQEIGNILEQLLTRGLRMRFVYTGGVSHFYNYAKQFEQTFAFVKNNSKISSLYYPEADHLLMLESHRHKFVNDACEWIGSEFSHSRSTSPVGTS